MATNKKIGDLTAATTAALTDLCVLLVGGLARKMTLTNLKTVLGVGATPLPLLHVRDEQTANTDAGTFTSGAWRTRALNTSKTNTITGASLASNQITLPAGTYEIEASAPAYKCVSHKARLQDTTGAATLIVGSSETSNTGSDGETQSNSVVRGRFTIAVESVLELQHRCSSTFATMGLGRAGNLDSLVEIYAEVIIRKVA